MKVLVTGFTPFGGEAINPAYEAVKLLPDQMKGQEIFKVEIPTEFHTSIKMLDKHMEELQPDVVICVGQAGGRPNVTIERVAINMDDARIPDNAGNSPVDEAIVIGGPAAYFSTLPIKAINQKIQEDGLPSSISNTAGTYVCNHLMYGLLHLIHTKFEGCRGGFIHVPFIESQVTDKPTMPSMKLESISRALELAIETCVEFPEDVKVSAGKEF